MHGKRRWKKKLIYCDKKLWNECSFVLISIFILSLRKTFSKGQSDHFRVFDFTSIRWIRCELQSQTLPKWALCIIGSYFFCLFSSRGMFPLFPRGWGFPLKLDWINGINDDNLLKILLSNIRNHLTFLLKTVNNLSWSVAFLKLYVTMRLPFFNSIFFNSREVSNGYLNLSVIYLRLIHFLWIRKNNKVG